LAGLPSVVAIKQLVALLAPGMIIMWPIARVKAGLASALREKLTADAIASSA
jgi:hypothetical protein